MTSQFIDWPITFPDENPNSPKPWLSLSTVHLPLPPLSGMRSRNSAKHVTPKQTQQRGLAIAHLEWLRMELVARETELLRHQPGWVVLPHMLVGSYPFQVGSGGGLLAGTNPEWSMETPGYMARYLAAPAPDPTSTQIVPRHLLSAPVYTVQFYADQCESCVRKKRLFGESSVCEYMDSANHFEKDLAATITPFADPERELMASLKRKEEAAVSRSRRWKYFIKKEVSAVERQTREYQFFPTYSGSLAELAFPTMSDASTSAPSRSAYTSQPIDLSLKLF